MEDKVLALAVRQCLIMLLGALEDYYIFKGWITHRSIVPHRKADTVPFE